MPTHLLGQERLHASGLTGAPNFSYDYWDPPAVRFLVQHQSWTRLLRAHDFGLELFDGASGQNKSPLPLLYGAFLGFSRSVLCELMVPKAFWHHREPEAQHLASIRATFRMVRFEGMPYSACARDQGSHAAVPREDSSYNLDLLPASNLCNIKMALNGFPA